MGTPTTKTEIILTSQYELVKQYQLLDIQGRPSKLYTAASNAKDGDPCIVTEFVYVDSSSSVLKGKFDGYDFWDESFIPDTDFTVSVATGESKTHILLTREKELTKHYAEIDGQNRVVRLYEASVIAVTGSPCLVTEYIYQNPTSTIFLGKKEGYATWDVTWVPDSAFTVGY